MKKFEEIIKDMEEIQESYRGDRGFDAAQIARIGMEYLKGQLKAALEELAILREDFVARAEFKTIQDQLAEEKRWCCWRLSPEDIEMVARENLEMDHQFSEDEIFEIRHNFKKSMEYNNENWQEILEIAIEDALS